MQDASLPGRLEQLGAEDGVLGVGSRQRSSGMLGVLEPGAHEVPCAPALGNPAGPECSASGVRCSAEEASGEGVGVWAPIKPSRRIPVATVLMRSSRTTLAPGSRRRQGRVDPIGNEWMAGHRLGSPLKQMIVVRINNARPISAFR